jgi:hypothetical protein
MLRTHLLAILALLALAAPAAAETKRDRAVKRSKALWATVNVCDTPARPDVIGIRGSMPGSGLTETLLMRFRVQYLDAADGKWHNIEKGADSGWVRVGRSRRRSLQSGYSFTFAPPADGGVSTLRGAVTFRWRAKGRTTRRFRELTEAGHRSTRGADPATFSAATCELR